MRLILLLLLISTSISFAYHRTGLKRPKYWYLESHIKFRRIPMKFSLPMHFDLREEHPSGDIQPIRNQGNCGSCWAFSVVAAVESAYALLNPFDEFLDLSEQELVSSCKGTGGDCGGGYFGALDYVKDPGLPTEEEHPYLAKNSRCRSDVTRVPRIKDWFYLGEVKKRRYIEPTIEELKNAIYTYRQALSVTVDAFDFSGDGIYTYCTQGYFIDHMVNLVGWHDFESEDEVKKYGAKGYWIMRNSWGKSFGKDGYAKVLFTGKKGRKCNNLGEAAAVVIIE